MASSINGNEQNVPLPNAGREKDGGNLNRKTAPCSYDKGKTDNIPSPSGYDVFDSGQGKIKNISSSKRLSGK